MGDQKQASITPSFTSPRFGYFFIDPNKVYRGPRCFNVSQRSSRDLDNSLQAYTSFPRDQQVSCPKALARVGYPVPATLSPSVELHEFCDMN